MKTMKDQPPERNRQGELSPRRFETNLALVLLTTVFCLWLLVDRSADLQTSAALGDIAGLPLNGFVGVGLVLAIVWLNFAFVRAETSLDVLKPVHLKAREEGSRRAEVLAKLLDRRAVYVATCNLGSQLARLLLVVVSFLIAPGLAAFLSEQFNLPNNYLTVVIAALILMIPIGLFNLIAGELVPKSLGALYPERVARMYSFVRGSSFIFAPLASLSTWVATAFTSRFGAKATFDVSTQAEEEIKTLVESAQESGAIEIDEKELLHSVFEFTDTVAREVMTPRVDVDAMSVGSDPDEVVQVIQESGHSRIPLFEETDDQIIGIVHAKDILLAKLKNGKAVDLRALMRPALFVPENKNLHDLLGEMKAAKTQMAVVQDEFGGTAGIVTMEDIVEELVGEIQDEYDVEEPPLVQEGEAYLVDGKMHLDDMNDILGSSLSSDAFDTVGGYVFGLFGRQPKEGEHIDAEGYRFTVVDTDGRRVGRLRIEAVSPEEEEEIEPDEARRMFNG